MLTQSEFGTVVATIDGPTPNEFEFIVSNENVRAIIEVGSFVQVKHDDTIIISVVQGLRRTNRYYSSPDIIHGSAQGHRVQSIYPSERWDYIIAQVKVLGCYKNELIQRSTRPVLPGSKVHAANPALLRQFLGIRQDGLHLGELRQSSIPANVNIDRLLQKHLAILSISGGGKSYTTSILIEEILRRSPNQGRPAIVLFDVHGEYSSLVTLSQNPTFKDIQVKSISSTQLNMAVGNLSVNDFGKIFPTMSNAQRRDLSQVLLKLRRKNQPMTVGSIITEVEKTEMNPLVKEALLGWLGQLDSTYLFGNVESPDLYKMVAPGHLLIIDLSNMTSLWKKQIVIHYFLSRIFELRRTREIPPVITILEEAHQFAPESESSISKSIIHTIAREGRKFLCSLVIISQRPINLSTTALSQCNSHLILRILNPYDLNYIGKSSEGINQETLQLLTTLGVGEALLVGEAVNYPIFIQIRKKLVGTEFDDASLSLESSKYERSIYN